ncbi:TetR/AcrR family transcriptional regulator [Pelotomaculum propionicicum]|uniref:TetR/AcrR family transcriptional regulator n=1 Tax=Pelotomaculum propionicicum TaxID=258475 RepID=UPI003B7E96E6
MNKKDTSSGSRVERKKEVTRNKIISVALSLFKKQGFNETTMEQIARDVDIAKGTLYNYFPVKEAIVDEYIKRNFREKNQERIRELRRLHDTRARLTLVLGEMFEGVRAQKDLFEKYIIYRTKVLLSFHQDDSEKSGFHLAAAEIIELGQKSGEIRNDLPNYVLVELFEFAFIEAAKQFYLEPEKFNVRETVELCVDLCLNGIRPVVGKE